MLRTAVAVVVLVLVVGGFLIAKRLRQGPSSSGPPSIKG